MARNFTVADNVLTLDRQIAVSLRFEIPQNDRKVREGRRIDVKAQYRMSIGQCCGLENRIGMFGKLPDRMSIRSVKEGKRAIRASNHEFLPVRHESNGKRLEHKACIL